MTCAIMRSTEALCWGSSAQTTYADLVISTIASTGDVGRSPALTTDGSGNWLLAYNDAGGISYARYDGSAWTTYSACASSDACDSTHGLGVGEDSLGGLHSLATQSGPAAHAHEGPEEYHHDGIRDRSKSEFLRHR